MATDAEFSVARGIDIGADGSLYIAADLHRILRVAPDGIITTVAGIGTTVFGGAGGVGGGFSGDGGLAIDAKLNTPYDVAIGSDGSIYIADSSNNRIRRIDPNGIITTVVGDGQFCNTALEPCGDGGLATNAQLNFPLQIALSPDDSLYIADVTRVRRVTPDGIISNFAGTLSGQGVSGDGDLAINTRLDDSEGVEVDSDGTVYIIDGDRIRYVTPDGIINTVAGDPIASGFNGDNRLATDALLNLPAGIDLHDNGNLYIADGRNYRVRKVAQSFSGFSNTFFVIASQDGSELYEFDSSGRHLRTLDTFTGDVLYSFAYDTNTGYLSTITDGDGDVTTIERNANGDPTGIRAHDGQLTSFTLDPNGYIDSITNPASESHLLTYMPDGLLTRYERPKGNANIFTYDSLGRLETDTDDLGGGWVLNRTDLSNGYQVTMTDGENRSRTFKVETLSTEDRLLTNTRTDGTVQTELQKTNGEEVITQPNGTVVTVKEGPDLRFGMQSPIPETTTVQTPSGLTAMTTVSRTATLTNNDDPLSLIQQTDTVTTNGRTATVDYTAATRTYIATSPTGRTRTTVVDGQGRVTSVQVPGINAINYGYDTRGRLQTIATGSRTTTLAYDNDGYLDTITDPLTRVVDFNYDPAGRVTQQILPDLRIIGFGYDLNGNLDSITPPSKPTHSFGYDLVDLQERYTPPNVGAGTNETLYDYDLTKRLTQMDRPDGQTITLSYDAAGKLDFMTIPRGVMDYAYNATTGQLNTITTPEGNALTFIYDGFLVEQESWAGEVAGTVSRGYDNNFWLRTLTVNNDPISFDYDNDGLLIQAGALTLTPEPLNGLLMDTTLGSVITSNTYNNFAELDGHTAIFNSTQLYSVTYQHDALGRIEQKTETVQGVTTVYDYDYDLAGRLDTVTQDGVLDSDYDYDDNGNRTHVNGVLIGQYDGQDRLLSYDGATYTYTANGELETKTVGSQVTSYDYDVLGNLTSVTLPNGMLIEYVVDGRNRRIGKKVNGTLVQGFVYQDQLNPMAELDGNGNVVARFIYADRRNVPSYMVKGGITYRIVADHLGSPRLVVDTTTGTIAQRLDYDEFGRVVETNPGFQPFGFAGGLSDINTGLIRFGFRDYDSSVGRWIVKDPIDFHGGSSNLYAYVRNDPINLFDMNGLSPDIPDWKEGWPDPPLGDDKMRDMSEDDLKEMYKLLKDAKENKEANKVKKLQKERDERNKGKQRGQPKMRMPGWFLPYNPCWAMPELCMEDPLDPEANLDIGICWT